MYPLWCWTIDPTQRFICASYASSVSEDIAQKCYNIYNSDKFKQLFPELVINASGGKTHFQNGLRGERYTTSSGSMIQGVHAHQKIIDDPISPLDAYSKTERNKVNIWISETISTRNVDANITTTIIVMQRLHDDDTTGYLLKKKGLRIKHICIPAELSANVKPVELKNFYIDGLFDPIRKNRERLSIDKIELGSYGYAGQMGQNPASEGGIIWRKEYFQLLDDIYFPPLEHIQFYGTDWDLAYTKDDDNAASAYITAGKVNNKMFIDDLGWIYGEFPELIRFMRSKARPHYIEAKASGKSAKQTLVKNGIPAIEVEVQGGADKVARARMSTPYAEAGMVYIRKSLAGKLFHDEQQGILSFPKNPKQDLADALAQSIQRLFKGKVVIANNSGSILNMIK
jgi:phage terminase large subunit-like protein